MKIKRIGTILAIILLLPLMSFAYTSGTCDRGCLLSLMKDYLAALVAHAHDRDFLVAADTYKINVTMDSHNCILESKSGREVWARQEKYCDNVYFDITPRELITGFISEAGFLDAAGMREHAQRWQRLEKDLAL